MYSINFLCLYVLPSTGSLIKCKSANLFNPSDGQQVAALRLEESLSTQGESVKKHRGEEKVGRVWGENGRD